MTEPVRRGTKRTSSTWEDCADKINMEACLNTAGECRRCDADEVLTTVAGVRSEPTQMQECEVLKWRRRCKRSSMETVISTRMSHKSQERQSPAKNCHTRVRRCNACIRALHEHPMHTNAEVDEWCQSVVHVDQSHATRYPRSFLIGSRRADRTSDRSQIEWWPVLAAGESAPTLEFWGERSVAVRKRPHDDSAKHVENLAGLTEVKSSTPELSTAARSAMSRRGMGVVSCLRSSEPADCQSYKAEYGTDVTVSVHKLHMQMVNSCKDQEEIHMDQEAVPATMNKSGLEIEAEELSQDVQTASTVLVWIDGTCSGEPVSCKLLLAGAGRLKNHAIDAPRVSRWEMSDCRWKHGCGVDENSETCRVAVNEAARYVKETTEQVTQATAEVPDATDSLNSKFERVKESRTQFFGVRDGLEQLTQKVEIARDEGRLAEEAVLTPESRGRELPERLLLGQTTLECAKENPSDLGTKIPQSDARSDRVSRLEAVAVTSRFAVLWMARAKWNCLGDICELTRADRASDEVILSGYWFGMVQTMETTGSNDGMVETTGSTSTFVTNAGAGGAVAEMMLVGRAAMCRYSVWSRKSRPSAEVQSSTRDQKNQISTRQVDRRMLSCALVGETEHVSQQEYSTSTSHGPKLV